MRTAQASQLRFVPFRFSCVCAGAPHKFEVMLVAALFEVWHANVCMFDSEQGASVKVHFSVFLSLFHVKRSKSSPPWRALQVFKRAQEILRADTLIAEP